MTFLVPGESRTAGAAVADVGGVAGVEGVAGLLVAVPTGVPEGAGLELAGREGGAALEGTALADALAAEVLADGPQPLRTSAPTDRETRRPVRPTPRVLRLPAVVRLVACVQLVVCIQLVTVIPSWSSGAPVAP